MILGMDLWVFTAWLGTIFSSILCLAYGIYHEYVKPQKKTNTITSKDKMKMEK
jgi:hypothetical protein